MWSAILLTISSRRTNGFAQPAVNWKVRIATLESGLPFDATAQKESYAYVCYMFILRSSYALCTRISGWARVCKAITCMGVSPIQLFEAWVPVHMFDLIRVVTVILLHCTRAAVGRVLLLLDDSRHCMCRSVAGFVVTQAPLWRSRVGLAGRRTVFVYFCVIPLHILL